MQERPLSIVFAGLHEGRGDFPPHHHEVWELVYVCDGAVVTIQGGEPIHLTPGMILVNPPRVVHQDVYLRPYRLIYLFVEGTVVETCDRLLYDDSGQAHGKVFDAVLREWNAQFSSRDEMLGSLALQLEILIGRSSSEGAPSDRDRCLIEAERLLRLSVGAPVALEQVAAQIGVSRSWLYQAFRQAYGCSPHAHVSRLRLEKALALLRHSSHKIVFVAEECGYASASHLTHHVRSATGLSPSEIRESARRSPPAPAHNGPKVELASTPKDR